MSLDIESPRRLHAKAPQQARNCNQAVSFLHEKSLFRDGENSKNCAFQ
jgi:hypothetical protein